MSDDKAAVDTSCENDVVDTTSSCCASCGVAEVDDVKLKECDVCDLVRYCSVGCEQEDKLQHEQGCKKRAAELRDELLFKVPESSHVGECPICMMPLPLDLSKSVTKVCCSITICDGCNYANHKREFEERRDRPTCPFCRKPAPRKGTGELEKCSRDRIEANDPVATVQEGDEHVKRGDFSRAIEYYTKAAELGDVAAHFQLSLLYDDGQGVEKDEKKRFYHLEKAVIGGHPLARCNLGCKELKDGQLDRAIKHFIIAAKLGSDDSLAALKQLYEKGFIIKEDFATARLAHQGAVDATKSPQREAAEEFLAGGGCLTLRAV